MRGDPITSEELAFIAALDAEPENHWLRCVYADWLDDRGDPRAAGYRAMGRLGRSAAVFVKGYGHYIGWLWLCGGEFGWDNPRCLPEEWCLIIVNGRTIRFTNFPSRAAAEDAAAIAWAKLTPEQQARIFADAGVMV